jgi:ABC-type glutathione transport system ATPase component
MSDQAPAAAVTPAEAAPGAPLLDVDGLNVRLPIDGIHRPVLREVSFSLRPGEAFGLVGESGSGKSMTARAIDRLLPAGAQVTGSGSTAVTSARSPARGCASTAARWR